MKILHTVVFILVVVGALNWGLMGLGWFANADWNVIHMVLGSIPQLEAVVYVLVGLSGIWLVVEHKKSCRYCTA
jgi:uncharacterized membrane protein YuzA (DUF378 family)